MEKKVYIKPEIEVLEIETVEMIASSLIFKDGEVDTESGQLSNSYRPDRRGQWGDLWGAEED